MNERKLAERQIKLFHQYLVHEEKSVATVEKYLRDVHAFRTYVGEKCVTKDIVMEFKKYLQKENYAIRSINSMLESLNSFIIYMGWSVK